MKNAVFHFSMADFRWSWRKTNHFARPFSLCFSKLPLYQRVILHHLCNVLNICVLAFKRFSRHVARMMAGNGGETRVQNFIYTMLYLFTISNFARERVGKAANSSDNGSDGIITRLRVITPLKSRFSLMYIEYQCVRFGAGNTCKYSIEIIR